MSDKTSGKAAASSSTDAKSADQDLGQAEVQERVDQEQERGYRGTEVDPTPNENYTLQGVGAGLPTPETDDAAAAEARRATGRR